MHALVFAAASPLVLILQMDVVERMTSPRTAPLNVRLAVTLMRATKPKSVSTLSPSSRTHAAPGI